MHSIGPRLRELRQRGGMTLNHLSEITGISVSTLSRLESGNRKPTLELLMPLATAHGVALDDLVRAPDDGDPRVPQLPFTRRGSTIVPLSRHACGLQAFKQILPGSTDDSIPKQKVHEGYDWMFVLTGRVRLWLGAHDIVLGPGEVAEFDTRVPHAYRSAGPERAEILALYGHHGERIHVRASTSRGAPGD